MSATRASVMAKKLRELREEQGLTVDQLAGRAGNVVASSTIGRIERGQVSPNRATRVTLANALGVRVDDIDWPEKGEGASSDQG